MEIIKLCSFSLLPEGLLYIHLALSLCRCQGYLIGPNRNNLTRFFVDTLYYLRGYPKYMIAESSQAVFDLIPTSMNFMKLAQNITLHATIYSEHSIQLKRLIIYLE